MDIIKAPDYGFMDNTWKYDKPFVFLAGSIEMGKAEEWQKEVEENFSDVKGTIFNPRRDDWDSSWEQKIENSQFRKQVEWELFHLMSSDEILMYFSPGTKSPITLFEFGFTTMTRKLHVVCPDGFWRKGNIDIVCKMFDIKQYSSIGSAVEGIRRNMKFYK